MLVFRLDAVDVRSRVTEFDPAVLQQDVVNGKEGGGLAVKFCQQTFRNKIPGEDDRFVIRIEKPLELQQHGPGTDVEIGCLLRGGGKGSNRKNFYRRFIAAILYQAGEAL